MSAPEFSVTSPDLVALEGRLRKLDPAAVYRRATYGVADELGQHLAQAMKSAGASDALLDEIGTYTYKNDEGPQRREANRVFGRPGAQDVVHVGLPAGSRHLGEAVHLEYGDQKDAPQAPMRNTLTSHAHDLGQRYGNALTHELFHAPVRSHE